jgi:hypothetical protein
LLGQEGSRCAQHEKQKSSLGSQWPTMSHVIMRSETTAIDDYDK